MPQLTIQQAFDLAMQHHQAGRLQDAEQFYRQILAQQPDHAAAVHGLGVIAIQVGHHDIGVELLRRAIALQPSYAEAYSNLGSVLKDKGRLDEAIAACRQAIVLKPDFPEAHNNLGIALKERGQSDDAVAAYRQAIILRPNFPEAYNNLGVALRESGQLDEAVAACRAAIALRPDYPEAYGNLGNALNDSCRLDEAIAAYRQGISLKPNYADTYSNLGDALNDKELSGQAIAACRAAISLRPDFPEAYNNLGNALKNKGQLNEAIASYRQAIIFKPDYPQAHGNLGNVLLEAGQSDEAIPACRRAIVLSPDFAEAHSNLAFALLLQGDFRQGWNEYEWRWKCKDFHSGPWSFPEPPWDGADLDSRTILIHAEQGLGDTIQFMRYLPLVAERGGNVIFGCDAQLRRLLQTASGITKLLIPGEAIPPFDTHCPLLSLPRAFATTLESIPAKVPYLFADPKLSESWRSRFAAYPPALNVGLVWAGNPNQRNDRNRSMKLADMLPLMRVPGVRFFTLQKGDAAAQARTLPEGIELIDWTNDLNDFADTAALIDNLDLVISVCTAVAHLAGAMGKPVWTPLAFAADWRWLLHRTDSPWYPTMRLFRQPARGDWQSVVAEIANALQMWIKHQSPRPGSSTGG